MNETSASRELALHDSHPQRNGPPGVLPFEQTDIDETYRRPWRLALGAILAFFGVGTLIAALAPLTSAVIAPASVVADGQRIEVKPLNNGIVTDVAVKEGETVRAGQSLVTIDDGAGLSSFEVKLNQLRRVSARVARLRAQLDGAGSIQFDHWSLSGSENADEIAQIKRDERRVLSAERASDASQIGVLASRNAQTGDMQGGLEARIESLEAQQRSVQKELDAMAEIAERGFVSRNQIAAREREIARLQGQIGEARAELARLSNAGVENQQSRGAVVTGRREELAAQLSQALADQSRLEEETQIAQTGVERMQLTAPVDGEILNLGGVAVGAAVAAGQGVLQIVPATRALTVVGQVRPIDIESARMSGSARVVFSDVRAQNKEFTGRIERLSADVLQPSADVAPYYEVAVQLDPDEVRAQLGDVPALGAPATVYLEGEESTLLMYLIAPIRDLFRRGLRESGS